MSEEISQEKAREYMEIAALVCLDLDVLKDIAECRNMTAQQLVKQILHTHKQKENLINDQKAREMRYGSASLVFAAVDAGLVRSEPFK